jgi:hypothetical protein
MEPEEQQPQVQPRTISKPFNGQVVVIDDSKDDAGNQSYHVEVFRGPVSIVTGASVDMSDPENPVAVLEDAHGVAHQDFTEAQFDEYRRYIVAMLSLTSV